MSAPDTVTVQAPAKINLSLRVLGRRRDGYHDIESLVAPVSVFDRLTVHAVSDPTAFRTLALSLEVTGPPEITGGVPAGESNLVLRAARLLAERAEIHGFADLVLDKRIPAAAGLGGGSSDAAAALRALGDLWRTGLSGQDLLSLGAEVGSDVPALLVGGPVRASGRGDVVRPAAPLSLRVALATFGFGVRTADAYRWWDEDGGPHARPEARVAGELVANDLEGPVLRRHPILGQVKDLLSRAGAAATFLSGSGPTVAAILPDGVEALDPAGEAGLQDLGGRPLLYARTLRPGR